MKTKVIFCANHLSDQVHDVTIDNNGEFLFTCNNELTPETTDDQGNVVAAIICGRSIKFVVTTKEELDAQIAAHKEENNVITIKVEDIEKKLDEFL